LKKEGDARPISSKIAYPLGARSFFDRADCSSLAPSSVSWQRTLFGKELGNRILGYGNVTWATGLR
jgi:hypothetical protein